MAPEQIGGRRGDARTDVYAVGTMLYEMLTGNLPFSSANPHALLRAKANEDPTAAELLRAHASIPALEAIILRAIERAPRDRYPSAAELLADLRDPGGRAARDPDAPPGAPRACAGALVPRRRCVVAARRRPGRAGRAQRSLALDRRRRADAAPRER